ncbi:SAC3/GANP domain protein, partial [Reticulomyxa filosa]
NKKNKKNKNNNNTNTNGNSDIMTDSTGWKTGNAKAMNSRAYVMAMTSDQTTVDDKKTEAVFEKKMDTKQTKNLSNAPKKTEPIKTESIKTESDLDFESFEENYEQVTSRWTLPQQNNRIERKRKKQNNQGNQKKKGKIAVATAMNSGIQKQIDAFIEDKDEQAITWSEEDGNYAKKNNLKRSIMTKEAIFANVIESDETAKIMARKARFQTKEKPYTKNDIPIAEAQITDKSDYLSLHIIGTCKEIEKPYLRLTCVLCFFFFFFYAKRKKNIYIYVYAPKPEEIRDEETCNLAFRMILKEWNLSGDYAFVGNQFKSLRQDLRVQHIRNQFTVDVYECNARICLEVGDLSEFNQCQSQLKELYKLNKSFRQNFVEFLSYRLLYFAITRNSVGIIDTLKTNSSFRRHPEVSFSGLFFEF